ncbi:MULTISPECIES: hypothetical protein [Bacillus]|uniref:hypothetical protein n=1 Tax=Bacillus TaxID=1386 RepID=UPI0016018B90|nr:MULTISPECIES: hypothetical protein [Bacillus]MED3513090.1 hypothetical protein [Bacillus subtilis]MED3518385.1 hypothetical protein [Bacillus subtilis]QNA80255.1 hypothetical protein G4G26_09315 [Bacillus subtilis]UKS40570.1 hypothetical protein MAK48_09480 [Bacillus sp. Man122]
MENTKITINGVEIYCKAEYIEGRDNHLSIQFITHGGNEYHLYSSLFSNDKLDVVTPRGSFVAKVESSTTNYQGELDRNTTVSYSIVLKEAEANSNENLKANSIILSITNKLDNVALVQLLVEKELIDMDEFESKLEQVKQKELPKIQELLLGDLEAED